MPTILIKDITGVDRSYSTTDVAFRTPTGTANFTYGEKQNLSITLDFSSGDMYIIPESGIVYGNISIPTPNTLLAENIVEGVTIAGITGIAQGGGGETADWTIYDNKLNTITQDTLSGSDDDVVLTWCFRILKEIITI